MDLSKKNKNITRMISLMRKACENSEDGVPFFVCKEKDEWKYYSPKTIDAADRLVLKTRKPQNKLYNLFCIYVGKSPIEWITTSSGSIKQKEYLLRESILRKDKYKYLRQRIQNAKLRIENKESEIENLESKIEKLEIENRKSEIGNWEFEIENSDFIIKHIITGEYDNVNEIAYTMKENVHRGFAKSKAVHDTIDNELSIIRSFCIQNNILDKRRNRIPDDVIEIYESLRETSTLEEVFNIVREKYDIQIQQT